MTQRFSAFILIIALISLSGCSNSATKADPADSAMQATVAEPKEPAEKSEVELSDAKLTYVPPDLLRFEVHYRFTKGRPTMNYMCNLSFPGSDNVGRKPLDSWEMKTSGVIRGGIELQSYDPPVKAFEITLGEAEVPQSGYQVISNVLKGEVAYPSATPPKAAP